MENLIYPIIMIISFASTIVMFSRTVSNEYTHSTINKTLSVVLLFTALIVAAKVQHLTMETPFVVMTWIAVITSTIATLSSLAMLPGDTDSSTTETVHYFEEVIDAAEVLPTPHARQQQISIPRSLISEENLGTGGSQLKVQSTTNPKARVTAAEEVEA